MQRATGGQLVAVASSRLPCQVYRSPSLSFPLDFGQQLHFNGQILLYYVLHSLSLSMAKIRGGVNIASNRRDRCESRRGGNEAGAGARRLCRQNMHIKSAAVEIIIKKCIINTNAISNAPRYSGQGLKSLKMSLIYRKYILYIKNFPLFHISIFQILCLVIFCVLSTVA